MSDKPECQVPVQFLNIKFSDNPHIAAADTGEMPVEMPLLNRPE